MCAVIVRFQIHIVGKNNLQHVLRSCRDTMASEIMKLEGRNGADAPFRKCFDEIEALISKNEKQEKYKLNLCSYLF